MAGTAIGLLSVRSAASYKSRWGLATGGVRGEPS